MPTIQERKDPAGFKAGKAARKIAEQTPPDVLCAMLAKPVTICGIELQPMSLDTLWCLQACGNPLGTPGKSQEGIAELNHLGIAQLIFAFAEPARALDAASEVGEEGQKISPYDRAAMAFIRAHVPMAALSEIGAAIAKFIVEGLATAPGAGDQNPPQRPEAP